MYVVFCDMMSVCICNSIELNFTTAHAALCCLLNRTVILWNMWGAVQHGRFRNFILLFTYSGESSLNQETYLTDFSKMCSFLLDGCPDPGVDTDPVPWWSGHGGQILITLRVVFNGTKHLCSHILVHLQLQYTLTILISIIRRSRNVGSCNM